MWIPFKCAVCFYFSLGVWGGVALSNEKDLCPLPPQDGYSWVYVTSGTTMLRHQALWVRAVRTFMFFRSVLQRTIWHSRTMKYVNQALHKTWQVIGIPEQRGKSVCLKISCCLQADVWLQTFTGNLHPFFLPMYTVLGCSFIWVTLNLLCSSGSQKPLGQATAYALWVKTPWFDTWK